MVLLYGRAGRLTAKSGGFRPPRAVKAITPISVNPGYKPYLFVANIESEPYAAKSDIVAPIALVDVGVMLAPPCTFHQRFSV